MVDFLINIPGVKIENSVTYWAVYLNKFEIVQLLLDKPGFIDYIKRIRKDAIEEAIVKIEFRASMVDSRERAAIFPAIGFILFRIILGQSRNVGSC